MERNILLDFFFLNETQYRPLIITFFKNVHFARFQIELQYENVSR